MDNKPGATLADWAAPVASGTGDGGTVELDAGGAEGSYVLVWITDLGETEPRAVGGQSLIFVELADIEVLGR